MKLKQIERGLRKDHLLIRTQLAARQPHYGPGKVTEAPAANGMRIFHGKMLCAEGESSCVHPCDAFYTITGEEPPEDCKCKCTSNPHTFYKQGSVICTCPGSPVAPENDMYPYPPGEGPMAALEAARAADEAAAATASQPAALTTADAPTLADSAPEEASAATDENRLDAAVAPEAQPSPQMRARFPVSLAGMPFMGVDRHAVELERDIDARLASMGVKVQPLELRPMQPAQMMPNARLQGPQGLYVGGGQAFLPPDGDYPGGSTGIPMDGYLAFETGYGNQPYHGTYAPMQEAGIADRAPSMSLRQLRGRRTRVVNKAMGQPKWDSHGNALKHALKH